MTLGLTPIVIPGLTRNREQAALVHAVNTNKWSDEVKPRSDHLVYHNGIKGQPVPGALCSKVGRVRKKSPRKHRLPGAWCMHCVWD